MRGQFSLIMWPLVHLPYVRASPSPRINWTKQIVLSERKREENTEQGGKRNVREGRCWSRYGLEFAQNAFSENLKELIEMLKIKKTGTGEMSQYLRA